MSESAVQTDRLETAAAWSGVPFKLASILNRLAPCAAFAAMNPDKLFDYLDGRLSEKDRTELEAKLVSDSFLQRELAVARQIHAGMRNSHEVFPEFPDPAVRERGARLGRRVAVIFAALVFANVVFGVYAVVFMKSKHPHSSATEANRKQLADALQKTAAVALPTPNLEVDEIRIRTDRGQRNAIADRIIAAAIACGGSAVKNLSDENGLLLFAEIPAARENEFRGKMADLGAQPSKPAASADDSKKKIIQIRVVDNGTG